MIIDKVAESWEDIIQLCMAQEKNIAKIKDDSESKIVIFGAGTQGRMAFTYLKQCGINIYCFTDNNPDKHGTFFEGLPILSPNATSVLSESIILIAARNGSLQIQKQLKKSKIHSLTFDTFFITNNLLRISYVRNNLLKDDRSRIIYDAILKTMLTGDNYYCSLVMENNQYFAIPEFIHIGNDHFVDAGAYVGDTLERFIWNNSGIFKTIYAFEPGNNQFNAMRYRVDRLCKEWSISKRTIICENAGLSDKNDIFYMNTSSVLANISLSNTNNILIDEAQFQKIPCYSLDNYLADRPATFIKADIEGMELAMLYGAKKTIQHYKPKMALSIYHNPLHLIEIAEYVHSLNPEYQMAIRHHSPIFAESVLYCWIP
ncbi:MAG: FkbM family methyltransferase [Desulfamplus sp.]|nr:FkbM family methyltransferase [Desulfamplus sp.]